MCTGRHGGTNAAPAPGDLRWYPGSRSGNCRLAANRGGRHCAESLAAPVVIIVSGQFAFGDLSLAETLRSIELFAQEVMPQLVDRMPVEAV